MATTTNTSTKPSRSKESTSFFERRFISDGGVEQLDRYKYVGGEYSWLDNKMNPFWLWCSEQLPLWMAPNLVTFVGFVFIVSQYLIMLLNDQSMSQELPRWMFAWAALSVFIYQTLDAVDGKQARRTKSSSPLGQLFDHGCDSFSVAFFLLSVAQACMMEQKYVFYLTVSLQITIFVANWTEYHTHVLNTQVGNFGVTESQIVAMIIHLGAAIGGQRFWAVKLSGVLPAFISEKLINDFSLGTIIDTELYIFVVYAIMFGVIGASIACICNVVGKTQKDKEGNVIKINKAEAIKQWIPVVMIIFIEVGFFECQELYQEYAGVVLLSFGLLVSLLTCKLIICSLTHMKFSSFHFEILPYVALIAAIRYAPEIMTLRLQITGLLIVTFLTMYFSYYYTSSVIEQITRHLGIYCFSLKKRTPEKRE